VNIIFEKFNLLLSDGKKQEAVLFVQDLLLSKKMDIVTFYTEICVPSLEKMECKLDDKNICVWKEHIRTAILRTIVEGCYPFVIKYKEENGIKNKGKAIVLCPPEEYFDLDALIVSDFFTLCGFDTIFVGSNTPYKDFYNAANAIAPDIIAISVSNYYNLVVTKKIIAQLRILIKNPVKIVAIGSAFAEDTGNCAVIGADYCVHTFDDIKKNFLGEV